ncbi:hypothetical protein [Escherichia coli]|uniref:hypothetical protein n=1 Tax=Escherichia coli TaxID=562 RepID=UPI001F4AB3CE|nr:hypothetical protein [Escherichia coli]
MNIHNLHLVKKLYEEYNDSRQQLANLKKTPHMIKVTFCDTDLGMQARASIYPNLIAFYQKKVDDLEKRLKHLEVDLSELPEEEEEEE